jgi:DNA-binding LacI/PurR family transcriptional regulator
MAQLVRTVEYHSPRQREIVEAVRERIVSGELAPGSRVPSVNELAAAHKSSTKTALGALGYLRQRGFITCQRGSGSFVSGTPPNLTHFGIVFLSSPEPDGWWSHFLVAWKREAERFAAPDGDGGRRGLRISFYSLNEGAPAVQKLQSDVEADLLAGLIFPSFPDALSGTPILADRRTPKVVCSDIPMEGFTILDLDNDGLREKAFRYLVSRGRRRVAILVPTFHNRGELPTDPLIRLAASCGLTTHGYWIQGIDIGSPEWAANWTEFLCRPGLERPDALFITNDNLVPAATQGLLNAGVRVPDDIDVVAHCNFPYPTASAVPAKRVGFDMRRILRTGIDLIERQRRGEEAPPVVTVPALFDDELEPTAET